MQIYRFLTNEDTSDFCHRVSAALAKGWELHGAPQYAFDPSTGKMCCGQAVVKHSTVPYSPDMKLEEQ